MYSADHDVEYTVLMIHCVHTWMNHSVAVILSHKMRDRRYIRFNETLFIPAGLGSNCWLSVSAVSADSADYTSLTSHTGSYYGNYVRLSSCTVTVQNISLQHVAGRWHKSILAKTILSLYIFNIIIFYYFCIIYWLFIFMFYFKCLLVRNIVHIKRRKIQVSNTARH